MYLLNLVLLAQVTLPAQVKQPVLTLPEPGVDNPAAYQGYQTRFFRDFANNTVQIYIDGRSGRVVHLLANAENESVGLSARAPDGSAVPLSWGDSSARVAQRRAVRTLGYQLTAETAHLHVGWFLLGSMRVERDFQYWGVHREPFNSRTFSLAETDRLLAALGRLPPSERRRHLALLNASAVATLRNRLVPELTTRQTTSEWVARVSQRSLDGRDSLVLEIAVDPRVVEAIRTEESISLRARTGQRIVFTVRIASTATALTPLARTEIFTPEFLAFLRAARDSAPLLERQVRGVELLSSREKLMAGLPAYATYFGRDMLVSSLMMRSIWRDEMAEFAVASVLRKLSPSGEVSHEEAMGGQAVREAAAEYAGHVDAYLEARRAGDGAAANRHLGLARTTLRHHRRVRENYHMVDDEFQLPVLAAQWLTDPDVSSARKRAFLRDTSDGSGGESRLELLLRELGLVARMTADYTRAPLATNLVSFAPRDSGRWSSASWRDSGAGYAGGRFAMDVNAIWAPHALESIGAILGALPTLGFSLDSLGRTVAALDPSSPLGRYARDPAALRRAADTWWGAAQHFLVRLDAVEVRTRVRGRLAALPAPERDYWLGLHGATADRDSLSFLAVALDADGRPIGVANSDVATGLFLGGRPSPTTGVVSDDVLRDVRLFLRPYPVGLFIDGVGPVVANDAYAMAPVWSAFERDRYHGPRVVWGREVNLFLLGVARLSGATQDPTIARELRDALTRVLAASEASGFQSELWSYEMRDGRMAPVRYGTGSDVQLWSTTDLAVHFALWQLRRTSP